MLESSYCRYGTSGPRGSSSAYNTLVFQNTTTGNWSHEVHHPPRDDVIVDWACRLATLLWFRVRNADPELRNMHAADLHDIWHLFHTPSLLAQLSKEGLGYKVKLESWIAPTAWPLLPYRR